MLCNADSSTTAYARFGPKPNQQRRINMAPKFKILSKLFKSLMCTVTVDPLRTLSLTAIFGTVTLWLILIYANTTMALSASLGQCFASIMLGSTQMLMPLPC